jgi:hypothetical protein
MSTPVELERGLKAAKERFQRAIAALSGKHRGGEWQEYHSAEEAMLSYERQVAASRGEEYAEPCDFPVKWDTGAPMPHLLVSDNKALLAFLMREPDPNWDGSYVTVKSPGDERAEPLALVEFEHCTSAKLGAPNDEVFSGHPLFGKGQEPYRAQRVVNSRWLAETEKINSVHAMYRQGAWREKKHFIFWFHDSTFECIARSYKVETHRTSMKVLLNLMVERLVSD